MPYPDKSESHTDIPFNDSLSILKIWRLALLKPSAENFKEIMQDSQASMRRVQLWVFLIVLLSVFSCWLTLYGQWFVEAFQRMEYDEEKKTYIFAEDEEFLSFDFTTEYNAGAILLVCIFFLVFIVSSTGLIHAVAQLWGATGNFRALLYIQFAYAFPLYVLALVIYMMIVIAALSPFIGGVAVGILVIYQLFLETISTKLIYQLKPRPVVITVLMPVLIWSGLIYLGWLILN